MKIYFILPLLSIYSQIYLTMCTQCYERPRRQRNLLWKLKERSFWKEKGVSVLSYSNICNQTGRTIHMKSLKHWWTISHLVWHPVSHSIIYDIPIYQWTVHIADEAFNQRISFRNEYLHDLQYLSNLFSWSVILDNYVLCDNEETQKVRMSTVYIQCKMPTLGQEYRIHIHSLIFSPGPVSFSSLAVCHMYVSLCQYAILYC